MVAQHTFGGIVAMTLQLRQEMGLLDRVMHEINGKIMLFPSPLETKRRWTDVYDRWNALALNHPLISSPDPRLPVNEITTTATAVARMKQEALALYGKWKMDMAAAGVATSPPNGQRSQQAANVGGPPPTVTQQAEQRGPGILKGLLYGAALLGGAAALTTLWSNWKKPPYPVYQALPPNLPPGYLPAPAAPQFPSLSHPQLMLPTVPSMGGNSHTLAFALPAHHEETLDGPDFPED